MPGLTMKREPAAAASSNWRGVQNGAGADDGFLDFAGHAPDRFQRIGGSERDLDRRQAAARQRAGQRHGVGDIGDLQHRDDRLAVEERQELFGLAGHLSSLRVCEAISTD